MSNQPFPLTKIPPTAILDEGFLKTKTPSSIPSLLQIKNTLFTTSGRASIALALEHANITSGDQVLIPAYHCEAMVAPAKWRQATIVFYRIKPDTKADIEDIANKITNLTRAIIITHYFGFEQDLRVIRQLCDKHNIILIEDCAHAMFGLPSGQAIGTIGDYSIGSCMKFLPIYEGGILASSTKDLKNVILTTPSIRFQLKSAFNTIESAIYFDRLDWIGLVAKFLLSIKDNIWLRLKKSHLIYDGAKLGPSSSEGGFGLDEEWIKTKISWFSKKIIQQSNLQDIITHRRKNYQKIHRSLAKLPNCRILFDELPDHTVPWVFPIYVQQPDKYINPLRMQGIPVWRFGEFLDPQITQHVCPISVEYSKHIFQFPCHQSLTESEIDWMLETIKTIFSE